MKQNLLSEKLKELAEKYSIANELKTEFEPGTIVVTSDAGQMRFYYDFSAMPPANGMINVPLLHWRSKRRYQEIKNLLEQKMVETPLAMRIHHLVAKDPFVASLQDILFMEADLVEWILNDSIDGMFASESATYMNGILSTKGGTKISAELGVIADGSEPVLLHELIAKTGIVSDVAVDTQTQQYPIYVFNGANTTVYTDIDYELYGLSQTECDVVRFILKVLETPALAALCEKAAEHLFDVMAAAHRSSQNTAYATVEGGDRA